MIEYYTSECDGELPINPQKINCIAYALTPIKLPDWAKPDPNYPIEFKTQGAVAITEMAKPWEHKDAVILFRGPRL